MNVPMPVSLDVDSKKVGNGPLDCDLESLSLHVLHHLQKLGTLWAGEKGIVSVKNIDAVLPDEDAWASG